MELNNTGLNLKEAASARGLGRRIVSMLFATGGLASIQMSCSRRVFVGATDEFIARGLEGEVRVAMKKIVGSRD